MGWGGVVYVENDIRKGQTKQEMQCIFTTENCSVYMGSQMTTCIIFGEKKKMKEEDF